MKKSNKATFKSEHNLPFEIAEYPLDLDPKKHWRCFRVGTCEGLWCATDKSYEILAVTNDKPGNGHFNDVLQWFEQSCRRDKKSLKILEVWNEGFKKHLVNKRLFIEIGEDDVEKHFI